MPTSPKAQRTDFSLDVPGRYVCNGLDEALTSVALGGRPFDLIVVGGSKKTLDASPLSGPPPGRRG